MPVINTRKRKPSSSTTTATMMASPLDRLLSVSAQELHSRGTTIPTHEASDLSDSGSSYSGDFPLRRMRRTARRPAEMTRHDDVDTETEPSKRRRVRSTRDDDHDDEDDDDDVARQIDRMRELLQRVERRVGTSRSRDDTCSPELFEEIRQLQSTVEAMVGRGRGRPDRINEKRVASTPLEAVQTTHTVMRNIQAVLTEPPSAELLARHTHATLERLWHHARQAAEHEMRAKLTFWKLKAQDLRETLRAAVDSTAPDVVSPHPALQYALDFVSTFYLLEMAPDATHADGDDPAKALAIATANERIADELQRIQLQRLREMPVVQPLASSLLLLSQCTPGALPATNAYSPAQESSTSSIAFHADNGGIGNVRNPFATNAPVSRLEPLPAQRPQPPFSTGLYNRTSNTTPTPSFGSIGLPPVASSLTAPSATKHAAPTSRDGTSPQIHATNLNLAARRRLALLLESQLQAKTQAPGSRPPSAPPLLASGSSLSTPVGASATIRAPAGPTQQQAQQQSAAARPESSLATPGSTTPQDTASQQRLAPSEAGSGSDSDISHSGLGCATCGRNDSYSSLLLCDNGCEREFHTFCLQPPLERIPEGDWYCPKCLAMENIQHDSRVYSCSASLCNKITGAKYCTLHRCKFDMCLNRGNVGGFCRRHERYREHKAPRRVGAPSDSAVRAATASRVAPAQPGAPKARLNTDQLLSSMRQMGIWLPANMTGSSASATQ